MPRGAGGVRDGAWHDARVNLQHSFAAVVFVGMLAACAGPQIQQAPIPVTAAERLQAVPIEVLNPDVRQETIQTTICVPGYTASVRPSTTYTNGVKLKLLREEGTPASEKSGYELDHRIPLALGGHPRSIKNLMLQTWEGPNGAKAKDRLERRLQQLVCAGKVPLDEARRAIYLDWQGALRSYPPVTGNNSSKYREATP